MTRPRACTVACTLAALAGLALAPALLLGYAPPSRAAQAKPAPASVPAGGETRAPGATSAGLNAMASGAVVRQPGEPQLIFISAGEGMQIFAMLRNGKLLDVPDGSADEPLPAGLEAMAFQPGRILHLHAGGGPRKIQVVGKAETYCDAHTAAVRAFGGEETQGVATNYPLHPSPAHEPPAAAAYGTMNTIVANILRRNGVHPRYRERMLLRPSKDSNALEKFAAVPLRGSASPMLIASVSVEDNDTGPSYSLTVIAEADKAGKYQLVYEDFNIGSGGGEASTYADAFHYNADLDGDGTDELILSFSGYEWGNHYILQNVAGKWTKTVQGASFGC